MSSVGWTRYEGRALADVTLDGDALFAELEDYIRVHNPHFTDIRMERATATEECDACPETPGRWYKVWYKVTYLADNT